MRQLKSMLHFFDPFVVVLINYLYKKSLLISQEAFYGTRYPEFKSPFSQNDDAIGSAK